LSLWKKALGFKILRKEKSFALARAHLGEEESISGSTKEASSISLDKAIGRNSG